MLRSPRLLLCSVSATAVAFATPAFAQTPPTTPPAIPESCAAIKDEAAKQACADAATQIDPNANSGELETSPTRGATASAEATQSSGGAIVVTGSRLRRDERTSADPLTVIDPNVENAEGRFGTAEILQQSPLAQGSTQITSALSTNFVINGGEGVETISLRGLGANRTLVLLNGRRAGPAGVRGGVSAFDLNVIPADAIQSVDILKTGASSIYGSDAIAGVVNLITKKDLRGLQVRGFVNSPDHGGGNEYSLAGTYGMGIGDRGHVMIGANIWHRDALRTGDRDFLGCAEENVRNAAGDLVDPIDPRTGLPYCGGFPSDIIFITDFSVNSGIGGSRLAGGGGVGFSNLCGPLVNAIPGTPVNRDVCRNINPAGFTRRGITAIQFNRPGMNLDQYLSGIIAAPRDPYQFGNAPGFFPVGAFNATGLALENLYNDELNNDSVIPKTDRHTIFAEAGYDLTDNVNLYFEGLYNRRKTKTIAHRQLFFYQFTGDAPTIFTGRYGGGYYLPYFFCDPASEDARCDPTARGDPLNTEFRGEQLLLPIVMANANSSTDIKYFRGVAGARAELSNLLPNGFADFYFQHSRSDGDYTRDVIFRDAVEFGVAAFRTNLCAGTLTAIRGVPCIDIDYTDPRILAGNFTPQERAFLFGEDTGNTLYKQSTAELSFGGDAFQLPAGAVKFALGGQWRRDSINDTPGPVVLAGNSWGSTASGITAGYQRTTEAFGELEIPLIRDMPGIQELTFNGAARVTNTYAKSITGQSDSDKGNWTYKLAANWLPSSWLRLRATYGTSFRSPALFEQFLANETGFLGQASIDPCIRWGLSENARIRENCASQGIPEDYLGAGGSATTVSQGGIGLLDPETSKALTLSAIFTPNGWLWNNAQFSFAVDFIDINVKDQITQLGAANIVRGCYVSDFFPTDPLCSLFDRNPAGAATAFSIRTVRDPYLNIDQQRNKSLDFTTRFRQGLGAWGTLSILGQATVQLKDKFVLFEGTPLNDNGEVGDPKWVGDLNVSWRKAPYTITYGLNVIAGTNDFEDLQRTGGTSLNADRCLATAAAFALRGGPYCPVYKLPRVAYHSLSAEVEATKNISLLFGVSNLFNKKPPLVSTVGSPISAFGQVPTLGSYYDYFGRRFFMSVRANMPNLGF